MGLLPRPSAARTALASESPRMLASDEMTLSPVFGSLREPGTDDACRFLAAVTAVSEELKMARGWESKSVESQIEDASTPRVRRDPLTREELDLRARRESIELSRRRVAREIAETSSPARRASLELALAHLDEELKKLSPARS